MRNSWSTISTHRSMCTLSLGRCPVSVGIFNGVYVGSRWNIISDRSALHNAGTKSDSRTVCWSNRIFSIRAVQKRPSAPLRRLRFVSRAWVEWRACLSRKAWPKRSRDVSGNIVRYAPGTDFSLRPLDLDELGGEIAPLNSNRASR